MGWNISDPSDSASILNPIALVPSEGDITIADGYQTAVLWARRGTDPWVTDGPQRAATITVPPVVFTSVAEFERLRTLRSLSRRCVLTDDLGQPWPVKFTGDFTWQIKDTPGRDADNALIYVTLSLVGVL